MYIDTDRVTGSKCKIFTYIWFEKNLLDWHKKKLLFLNLKIEKLITSAQPRPAGGGDGGQQPEREPDSRPGAVRPPRYGLPVGADQWVQVQQLHPRRGRGGKERKITAKIIAKLMKMLTENNFLTSRCIEICKRDVATRCFFWYGRIFRECSKSCSLKLLKRIDGSS